MRFTTSHLAIMVILAHLLSGVSAPSALGNDDLLTIGDQAPSLEIAQWVQGEPVKQFEKGRVYVVHFLSTESELSIESLSQIRNLSDKSNQIVTISISVIDNRSNALALIKKLGLKTDHRFAIDKVVTDTDAPVSGLGPMYTNWMDASAQKGIPCVFIVNNAGQIAWIGEPSKIDRPLDQILNGSWDLKKAAAFLKRERDADKLVLQCYRAIAKNNGSLANQIAKQIAELVEGTDGEASILNSVVWPMVDPENKAKLKDIDLDLAAKLAERAVKVSDEDPAILDTLAVVYYERGEVEKAYQAQKKAIDKFKNSDLERDPQIRERLEKYKEARKQG